MANFTSEERQLIQRAKWMGQLKQVRALKKAAENMPPVLMPLAPILEESSLKDFEPIDESVFDEHVKFVKGQMEIMNEKDEYDDVLERTAIYDHPQMRGK